MLDNAHIVMFQPQVEEFEGNRIVGRSAVSVAEGGAAPVFGVVWMNARVDVDRDARAVTFTNIEVPRVRFPEADTDRQGQLVAILEREMPTWDLELSLDRFVAALDELEDAQALSAALDMTPPEIVFRTAPSVLVVIDGDPIIEEIPDTGLSRVINTPFLLVRHEGTGEHFLYAGADSWYTASAVAGPWSYTVRVPSEIAAMAPEEPGLDVPRGDDAANAGVNPELVIATVPTELLFTAGQPEYTALADARLMYVSNSDSTLVLELATQRHYTVLSGRWFTSTALQGPWEFIESEELPQAFRDIPDASSIADIRVHVAGTEEAKEAVLDARVPQTAAVELGRVALDLMWDGEPEFEAIPGTSMSWGVNTNMQVLAAEGRYWVSDNAVWYVSDAPAGPWDVATARPEEVGSIPPENPNYNLNFNYVYGSTADVVYVGYTPGYTHTYIYRVTVVHGTGFHHNPWHRHHFWPHHSTWGWNVRFNPWTGWSFGMSFSNGRFTFGIGFGGWHSWHHGWWGPAPFSAHWRGHRRGFYSGWHRGFSHGARAGFRAGARAGYARGNLFTTQNRTGARVRSAQPRPANLNRAASARLNAPQALSRTQGNNVFSDRDGNLYRRDTGGNWQQRAEGNWQNLDRADGAQRPAAAQTRPQVADRAAAARPASGDAPRPAASGQASRVQGLNRANNARRVGTQRTNNFRGAAGARRGGGGGLGRR